MLYLFTGNSSYLLQEEVKKWKLAFSEKFGFENVFFYDFANLQLFDIQQAFLERSLFSEKKLVFFQNFCDSSIKNFSFDDEFLEALKKSPNENIFVCIAQNPDKRKSLYKNITKIAEIKDFSFQTDQQIISFLHKKYPDFSSKVIQEIAFLKENNLGKIILECDKLLISGYNFDETNVSAFVTPEFGQSIFIFLDHILEKQSSEIFIQFERILQYSNYYAFFSSFLALLRTQVFISFLKEKQIETQTIIDILSLGNKSFLIKKRYKAKYQEIQFLYETLIQQDTQMKQGKLAGSDENYLKVRMKETILEYLAFQ